MTKEKILSKKGQFACVGWARPCKTLKSCDKVITKLTMANNVRIGAGYDNMAVVKSARENGELPKENQGLNGLEWVEYPYILRNPKTEKQFVRIETAKNTTFKSQYFINGVETTKAEIEPYLQASEKKPSGEMPTVMNINIENIDYIK